MKFLSLYNIPQFSHHQLTQYFLFYFKAIMSLTSGRFLRQELILGEIQQQNVGEFLLYEQKET